MAALISRKYSGSIADALSLSGQLCELTIEVQNMLDVE